MKNLKDSILTNQHLATLILGRSSHFGRSKRRTQPHAPQCTGRSGGWSHSRDQGQSNLSTLRVPDFWTVREICAIRGKNLLRLSGHKVRQALARLRKPKGSTPSPSYPLIQFRLRAPSRGYARLKKDYFSPSSVALFIRVIRVIRGQWPHCGN